MLFRLISKWKDLISIFLLAIWWKFLCWCFVSDQRRTANSVSAVSHFWALLFFLDFLWFYELKLVFDGDIDSDILLQASRKKKGQSGFCRWSFCNFCCWRGWNEQEMGVCFNTFLCFNNPNWTPQSIVQYQINRGISISNVLASGKLSWVSLSTMFSPTFMFQLRVCKRTASSSGVSFFIARGTFESQSPRRGLLARGAGGASKEPPHQAPSWPF